jgi:hypothetical protein
MTTLDCLSHDLASICEGGGGAPATLEIRNENHHFIREVEMLIAPGGRHDVSLLMLTLLVDQQQGNCRDADEAD